MNKIELKNCFFCGAKAPEIQEKKEMMDQGNLEGIIGTYKMECENCKAVILHDDFDEMIALWNYQPQEVV
jgi:hypothetical protein